MASRRAASTSVSLYFAYGSNMHEPQMHSRVPGSRKVGVGWLLDHEFLYSGYSQTWGGAVANVRRKKGVAVFGVLYSLPPGGLETLDRFEGYPRSYDRRVATITNVDGRKQRAALYFKHETAAEAPPNPAYAALIERAHRHHRGL